MNKRGVEMSEHAKQIQHGLAIANRKMMETASAMGRGLIIAHPGESWQDANAHQLLEEAKKSEWWKTHFENENDDYNICSKGELRIK